MTITENHSQNSQRRSFLEEVRAGSRGESRDRLQKLNNKSYKNKDASPNFTHTYSLTNDNLNPLIRTGLFEANEILRRKH